MQNNKKSTKDARPFSEIYQACTKAEQDKLKSELSYHLHRTTAAVANWCRGKCYPTDVIIRQAAADQICKILNIQATHNTLFPMV